MSLLIEWQENFPVLEHRTPYFRPVQNPQNPQSFACRRPKTPKTPSFNRPGARNPRNPPPIFASEGGSEPVAWVLLDLGAA
jgi:hypothetical protein